MTQSVPSGARPITNLATYPKFIRQKSLLQEYVPFSAATLWRLIKAGKFPKPVKVTNQITAWRITEIKEWSEDPYSYKVGQIDADSIKDKKVTGGAQ